MPTLLKFSKWLATVVTVLVLTLYFGRAFDTRRMPPPGPEHRIEFQHEFDASQEAQTDWTEYLAIETRLAAELKQKIPSESRSGSPADRYYANSQTHPNNYPNNWNHSYEISVPSPRGVAVLLHGLTDSPYSMRATAQTLADAGYNIVAARMPGHGFAVSGLLQARGEDWRAAVRIAVRRALALPGAEQSLLLVGYSNGGLLAVDYALRCDAISDLPCPDKLVLLSPAIAVTRAAAVMNWHSLISWLPYFEKFKWGSVLPEIDPFKFTSFPKRAAWEIHKISNDVHSELDKPAVAAKLPPILTFQSLVDNTVGATAIVKTLYERLPENGSELVIYDINRNNTLSHLMKNPADEPVRFFTQRAPMKFDVTILRNRNQSSNDIETQRLATGQTHPVAATTGLRWPTEMYSLSHIAIPFRPDDALYGDGSNTAETAPAAVLGALAPRGERGVLLLTSDYFLRTRHNPFYEFQSRRLIEWLPRHYEPSTAAPETPDPQP